MKKYFILSLLLVPFVAQAQQIELIGSTAQIMKENNLSANINLDTITNRKFLYAIGAMENLQGEIIVFNGKPLYAGLDENRQPYWEQTFDKKAIFLVRSNVAAWHKTVFKDVPISNRQELTKIIMQEASKAGLDTVGGFPFRIRAKADHIQAHIAYLRSETITNFTPQGKKKDDYPLTLEDQNVWIIGFAGKTAGGRFAMPAMGNNPASELHMHYIRNDKQEAGHIEDLIINGTWQLCLPIQ
ncbi:acetolactate decarboxylase [Mongoliitalea daihaiensis]|uniref:acetolactate decarboxylase n=1 Tax=Mongoliitalea daihaiensis TaxID=2782006 RepID=UPI001F32F2A0|nr:acetolactate decarboxylase [Mongoliitalea daihaiensis]UJP66143.1 acetolactate decarboxylase [Mongoliitalea daihaiensis]